MNKEFEIGIDIGSSSTKAVLYSENYTVIATASKKYSLIQTEVGMAEQDPEIIFNAVVAVLKIIHQKNPSIQDKIKYISFSSMMHSLLAISEEGRPLSPLYTWADNRSSLILGAHLQKSDLNWIYQRTGTPIHSMSPFSKLLWLKEEHADLFRETKRFVGIKEYITYRLTGQWKVDYSIASATGLLNLETLEWDEDILNYLNLQSTKLSDLVDTNYVFTETNSFAYQNAGLSVATQLVIGASDGCLANLGLLAMKPNEVAMTIGTSGAVRMVINQIVLDPDGRTFCYYLSKNRWVIGGAVNNGGNTFEWAAKLFSKDYDELNQLALPIPPGSEGLLFYPYLYGERSPLWDAKARAHFIGISPIHTAGHFVRAVMEGVLYNLAEVLDILEVIGGPAKNLKINGGFLNSSLWTQLAADIFNRPLVISSQFESSCLGAVLISTKIDVQLSKRLTAHEKIVCPNKLIVDQYTQQFLRYQALTGLIKDIHEVQ